MRSLDKALEAGVSESADLCLVIPSSGRSPESIDSFLTETSARTCATMVIPIEQNESSFTSNGPVRLEQRRLKARNESSNLNVDELTGRIKALCEIRHPLRQIREELTQLRKDHRPTRPGSASIEEQVQLASQIQNDLLPQSIENTDPLSVSALYLPADFVSGDIYDVIHLDEQRLGFSVADATGHGLPAALLALLVKNSLRGTEHTGNILEPNEVLQRLNKELCSSHLQQCQFLTALHAIFDRTTHRMRWARGGVPFPILIRPGQTPQQISSAGSLLGAIEDQEFEIVSHDMKPGDLLLFYTDGLEALLLDKKTPRGTDAILQTEWVRQLAAEGPEAAFAAIRHLAEIRDPAEWHRDDMTALAIRMD